MEYHDGDTLARVYDLCVEAGASPDWTNKLVLHLQNNGILFREFREDPPEEPKPDYGSLESIKYKIYELHDHHADGRDKAQELFEEWRTALLHFQPVFTAIQIALDSNTTTPE